MRVNRVLTLGIQLAAVSCAALALAACDVVVGTINAKGKAQDEWVRSYPVGASGFIEVVNRNGLIEVKTGPGSDIQVRAERIAHATTDEIAKSSLGDIEIKEDTGNGGVRLESRLKDGSELRNYEVKYHITVPSTVAVTAHNTNGTIDIDGVTGQVTMESTNGTVSGTNLAGAVDASTTNGRVELAVTKLAAGGIKAETVNGTVSIGLPKDAKATLKATCVHGSISVDEALKVQNQHENEKRRFDGQLNGGGPKVVADTTNGRIEITGK